MKRKLIPLLSLVLCHNAVAEKADFGGSLCKTPGYTCLKIEKKHSWSQLFPNEKDCDLVKRVNRTNEFLSPGMVIAVPKDLSHKSLLDLSPFPAERPDTKENVIVVNLKLLAFAAYDAQGHQQYWGPISAGSDQCDTSSKDCSTPKGSYRIQRKKDEQCYSGSFPETIFGHNGGAFMPYCMFFYKGYALHGSETLPGYNASHGCVRLFTEDARWLNHNFVATRNSRKGIGGTEVEIE